ncbi:MAG: outer membrane beta-barrel protein [Bacteroidales bacterium]|nr:outer membrane beta-barrel protein [Bacteroidales bacterium]
MVKVNNVLAMFLVLAFSFLMPKSVSSQIMEVGATGSLPYYVGDLNPNKHFSDFQPSFGGVLRYYQNLRWAFRFQYSHYNLQIQPTDEIVEQMPVYGDETQFQFPINQRMNDFALLAEFNFFDYWTGSKKDYVTPYIFAGLSCFNYATKENPAERGFDFSLPFGAGVKYSVVKRLGVTFEWRMNKTFNDDIDNVNDISDEFNFGYDNDWIGTLELSIVYSFNLPRKVNCHSGITTRK